MITTRKKALEKLIDLEKELKEVIYYAKTQLSLEVGKQYIELIPNIRRILNIMEI